MKIEIYSIPNCPYCVKAKNLATTSVMYKQKSNSYFEEIVSRVYSRYDEILENSNACDFDDLLLKTNNILKENLDIRKKWSRRYKHVIIDEFQDTNPLQFEISNLITNEQNSISVVGDPDQSIYSWRHAVPTNLFLETCSSNKYFGIQKDL